MFIWKMSAVVLLISTCLPCYAVDSGGTLVNFRGRVVDQNPCTINNGEQIVVPFGNVSPKTADGETIKKKLNISVKCTGVNNDNGLKMQIIGASSLFDFVLDTSMDEMGIVFYKNNTIVDLHTWFTLPVPAESLLLTASPVMKNEGNGLRGGEFKASATLLINLQ